MADDETPPPVQPMAPVPVAGEIHVLGTVPTTEEPADFGTYRSIVLAGTEDKQMILPQDDKRVRASISCSGTGPVYIGSEAQCAAVKAGNAAAAGYVLATGQTLPVQHKQSVWMIPDQSHTAIVSIAQERMR